MLEPVHGGPVRREIAEVLELRVDVSAQRVEVVGHRDAGGASVVLPRDHLERSLRAREETAVGPARSLHALDEPLRRDERGHRRRHVARDLRRRLRVVERVRVERGLGLAELARELVEDGKRQREVEREHLRADRPVRREAAETSPRVRDAERDVREALPPHELDLRARREHLVAERVQVRSAIERRVEEPRLARVAERPGHREIEDLRVHVEVGDDAANAEQERERDARLPQVQERRVERLIRLELLHLDALEIALVDGASREAVLEFLQRRDVRRLDVLGELPREDGLRDLRVGRLHLEDEVSLRVDTRELRGRERVPCDLHAEVALAAERVFERGRVREADAERPRAARRAVEQAVLLARLAVRVRDRVADGAGELRVGDGARDLHHALGVSHRRVRDEQIEAARPKDSERLVEREQLGNVRRLGDDACLCTTPNEHQRERQQDREHTTRHGIGVRGAMQSAHRKPGTVNHDEANTQKKQALGSIVAQERETRGKLERRAESTKCSNNTGDETMARRGGASHCVQQRARRGAAAGAGRLGIARAPADRRFARADGEGARHGRDVRRGARGPADARPQVALQSDDEPRRVRSQGRSRDGQRRRRRERHCAPRAALRRVRSTQDRGVARVAHGRDADRRVDAEWHSGARLARRPRDAEAGDDAWPDDPVDQRRRHDHGRARLLQRRGRQGGARRRREGSARASGFAAGPRRGVARRREARHRGGAHEQAGRAREARRARGATRGRLRRRVHRRRRHRLARGRARPRQGRAQGVLQEPPQGHRPARHDGREQLGHRRLRRHRIHDQWRAPRVDERSERGSQPAHVRGRREPDARRKDRARVALRRRRSLISWVGGRC